MNDCKYNYKEIIVATFQVVVTDHSLLSMICKAFKFFKKRNDKR